MGRSYDLDYHALRRRRRRLEKELEDTKRLLGPCPSLCFCVFRKRYSLDKIAIDDKKRAYSPRAPALRLTFLLSCFIVFSTVGIVGLTLARELRRFEDILRPLTRLRLHVLSSALWHTYGEHIFSSSVGSLYFLVESFGLLVFESVRKIRDEFGTEDFRVVSDDRACRRIKSIHFYLSAVNSISGYVPIWFSEGISAHRCHEYLSEPITSIHLCRFYVYLGASAGCVVVTLRFLLSILQVFIFGPISFLWNYGIVSSVCILEDSLDRLFVSSRCETLSLISSRS